MKISNRFSGKFFKSDDLNSDLKLTIGTVKDEELNGITKPVFYFDNSNQGLVLNKTNAQTISGAYGDETDDWTGKEIIIYPTEIDFRGERKKAIRIKIPPVPPEYDESEIPF